MGIGDETKQANFIGTVEGLPGTELFSFLSVFFSFFFWCYFFFLFSFLGFYFVPIKPDPEPPTHTLPGSDHQMILENASIHDTCHVVERCEKWGWRGMESGVMGVRVPRL